VGHRPARSSSRHQDPLRRRAETFEELLASTRSYDTPRNRASPGHHLRRPRGERRQILNQSPRSIYERATDIHVEPSKTISASAIASMAFCTKSPSPRSFASCKAPSSRAEGDGPHGYRRAPPPAGWPHQSHHHLGRDRCPRLTFPPSMARASPSVSSPAPSPQLRPRSAGYE